MTTTLCGLTKFWIIQAKPASDSATKITSGAATFSCGFSKKLASVSWIKKLIF